MSVAATAAGLEDADRAF